MKKTAIISAVLLGATSFSLPAFAQSSTPAIPGSETVIEQDNAAERENIAGETAGTPATTAATPEQDTLVPGSDSQTDLNRAAEREGVAEGTDATTTGAMTPDGAAPIVPGSGATFDAGQSPTTQSGEALQDEADTNAAQ